MICNCTLVYLPILKESLELTKSSLTFGGGHDTVTVLTLRCRNCHAQVARSTAICATLYNNAREFVPSERSRKSASRSRWYCCSRRMSSSLIFKSRSLLERTETCERSWSVLGFVEPTTISKCRRMCAVGPNQELE
jgi:hypothetical protein